MNKQELDVDISSITHYDIHSDTDTGTVEYTIDWQDLSRQDIRSLIFHLLYAAQAHDYQEPLHSIIDSLNYGFDLSIAHDSEATKITQSVIDDRQELENIYAPFLTNWRIERVSVCTKLILLFAIWEFKYTQTDTRIIINEAIELAKCFAEEDAYRFVNGILDSVSKELRKKL